MTAKGIKISGLTPDRLAASGALEGALAKFDWFYIGAEFCENLIPPPAQLLRTAEFFLRRGRRVCLLTPPVSERGIKSLAAVFRKLRPLAAELELTANDFGTMELAAELGFGARVSAGRLLLDNLFIPSKTRLQLVNAEALRFFTSRGVSRFEISSAGAKPRSNFGEWRRRGFRPSDFSLTLYYPYLNMTTTRACLLGAPDIPPHGSVKGIFCRRECGAASFEVRHPLINEELLVQGNTVFMRFPRKFYSSEKDLEKLRVDRLVYCPKP